MDSHHVRTTFYRATLSSLFAGIVATLMCLGYDIIYREQTGFSLSGFINVSSIIFLVNILFLIAGVAYSLLLRAFKKADIAFVAIFLVLIIFCIWKVVGFERSPIHQEAVQFRGLLIGILLILGLGIGAVPILFHNRKFEQTVL